MCHETTYVMLSRHIEAVIVGCRVHDVSISHFDGYPALLVQLKVIGKRALRETIVDGWLACAPPKLAEEFLQR